MSEKERVVLAAHLNLHDCVWSVAAIDLQQNVSPLVQSQPGDLTAWQSGNRDERTSFLRHRIAGILQRGSDRLWGRNQKAQLFCIVFPSMGEAADDDVIQDVAQHFCTWLLKPPVICVQCSDDDAPIVLASNSQQTTIGDLKNALPELEEMAAGTAGWELAPPAPSS